MRRVLFDQNVPYPLKAYLTSCEVSTAEEKGWQRLSNGELIARAEANFDVLITCDQNVRYQQNLSRREIALVVLGSNIWPAVEERVEDITRAVEQASRGSFQFISIEPPKRIRRIDRQ